MIIPLNKFLAQAGVCSRRKAVELIEQGSVSVNGVVITEPGHKVTTKDKIMVQGKLLRSQTYVYILLNKPKDYITTVSDERDRKTVMDLLGNEVTQRVYPVGRLDRKTTGLLLLTNDGELAQALAHPKYEIEKVYHVTLDRLLTAADMRQIGQGVMLSDGQVIVDECYYLSSTKKSVSITVHSGKNRVIRRLFEELGYEVKKLDRVEYAGLTTQGLPLGQWRYLTASEVALLKEGA